MMKVFGKCLQPEPNPQSFRVEHEQDIRLPLSCFAPSQFGTDAFLMDENVFSSKINTLFCHNSQFFQRSKFFDSFVKKASTLKHKRPFRQLYLTFLLKQLCYFQRFRKKFETFSRKTHFFRKKTFKLNVLRLFTISVAIYGKFANFSHS